MALAKRPRAGGGRHQIDDAEAAGRFTGDSDVLRVAPKGRDVAPNPPQGLDLVHQPIVAGQPLGRFRAERRMGQIAQDAEPIVDRHHHHAFGRQARAVVQSFAARSGDQGAAVDPDDDRRLLRIGRRPDVQRQTVLAGPAQVRRIDRLHARRRLDAGRAEIAGVAHAVPARRGDGRTPAALPHRRHGVGHALEGANSIRRYAGQVAGRGLNHRALWRACGERRCERARRAEAERGCEAEGGAARQRCDPAAHWETSVGGRRPSTCASQRNRPMARR